MDMPSVLLRYHCYCDPSTVVRDHTQQKGPNTISQLISILSQQREGFYRSSIVCSSFHQTSACCCGTIFLKMLCLLYFI